MIVTHAPATLGHVTTTLDLILDDVIYNYVCHDPEERDGRYFVLGHDVTPHVLACVASLDASTDPDATGAILDVLRAALDALGVVGD